MRIPWRVFLGVACGALAWTSFNMGLAEFVRRVDVIQQEAVETGSKTVYLGDVEWANRAASTGFWVATGFVAVGLFFFVRAFVLHRRRRMKGNVIDPPVAE